MSRTILHSCFLLLSASLLWGAPAEVEFFEKKVRPLLVEQCYECHSAEKKVKGGLRLDSRVGIQKGGDSGPALIPGAPNKSLIIKAIRYDDPDLQMPPKRRLSQEQVAVLEQWIQTGAHDPRESASAADRASQTGMSIEEGRKFWAYQAPRESKAPAVRNETWARSDIDRYLLAAMKGKNLAPAPDAERLVLARRAYFDLTGLPPTPEQLDGFAADPAADAFEKLVERLLASPQFGEHWARHWFDVVRFAESVTLRGFIFKEAWRYRDYVIDSFNRDLPYDQFIKEQIAGDLMPASSVASRRRQAVATTFLMLGNTNLEEQDKKQLDMDVVDEQLDTLGKAFLAQTIGCARCHDHKFDPIPTRDYYALAGILQNATALKHANVSAWLESPLPLEEDEETKYRQQEAAIAALKAEIQQAKAAAQALAGKSAEPKDGKAPAKSSIIPASALPGVVVDSSHVKMVGEWKHSVYSKHFIGDGYLHDANDGKGQKTLTFDPELGQPGRYEVRFAYVHAPSRASNVPVTVFHADGETTLTVNQQEAPVIDGRFVSLGQYRFEANGFGHVLVSTEGTRGFVTADAVQFIPVEKLELAASGGKRADSQQRAAKAGTHLKALEEKLKQLQDTGPKRPMYMTVQDKPRCADIPVHIRGSVHNLGPTVPRGFLSVANSGPAAKIPETTSGRRELADWIASGENPLTARVMVNRVWSWLMGEGLVRTVDNFGTTGEKPSHPELLDLLAVQFVREGWSVKHLVRKIMLSRAYQLSSLPAPEAAKADPENRFFTHAHRRRLPVECMRDALLAASGELDIRMRGRTFPESRSADYGFQYTGTRRSIYIPVFRNALPDMFEVFDFPPPSLVTGRRNQSAVATQALFLLNHPFVREQAAAAARRLLASRGLDESARIERAYRQTLGRPPTRAEKALALQHLATAPAEGRPEAWTALFHALFASLDFRYLN